MTEIHSTQITTRGATPQDALSIGVLGMQVFLDTYATEGIRDAIAQEALDAFLPDAISKIIAQPDTLIVVAEVNHHLVGFAQVALRTDHELIGDSGAAELKRLYVQERFTGKGVGCQLLQSAEEYARLGGGHCCGQRSGLATNELSAFIPVRATNVWGLRFTRFKTRRMRIGCLGKT